MVVSSHSAPTTWRPTAAGPEGPTVWVFAAIQPDNGQILRLRQIMTAYLRYPVTVQIQIDATVIGGIVIRVGDTVIDASLRGRIETLRHHLRAQARIGGPHWSVAGPAAPASAIQRAADLEGASDAS